MYVLRPIHLRQRICHFLHFLKIVKASQYLCKGCGQANSMIQSRSGKTIVSQRSRTLQEKLISLLSLFNLRWLEVLVLSKFRQHNVPMRDQINNMLKMLGVFSRYQDRTSSTLEISKSLKRYYTL